MHRRERHDDLAHRHHIGWQLPFLRDRVGIASMRAKPRKKGRNDLRSDDRRLRHDETTLIGRWSLRTHEAEVLTHDAVKAAGCQVVDGLAAHDESLDAVIAVDDRDWIATRLRDSMEGVAIGPKQIVAVDP